MNAMKCRICRKRLDPALRKAGIDVCVECATAPRVRTDNDFFATVAKAMQVKAPPASHAPTRAEQKLINASVLVTQDAPTRDEIAYMARELVACTLPHSDPGHVPFWVRQNGNLTLSIVSRFDPETNQLVGYPYGSLPRLLLFWMTSEAVKTGSRRLHLGATYNGFLRAIGLSPETGRGPRGDAARVRMQSRRLFTSTISFIYNQPQLTGVKHSPPQLREAALNMTVTNQMMLWWDPDQPDQMTLWDNWIELGDSFFAALTTAAVPLDMRALGALKRSPLALDLYAWATHKAIAVARKGQPQFVPWRALKGQFGADYTEAKDFKRAAATALKKITVVYPGLKLDSADGGIIVLPSSKPAIASKRPD